MLVPDIVNTSETVHVKVGLTGLIRGGVVLDYTNVTGRPVNANVVKSINVQLYKEVLLETFQISVGNL